MDTTGVAAYSLQHQPEGNKKLELVGGAQYAVGYQAMLVSKESPQLRDALAATMQSMIGDGTYAKIFEKMGSRRKQARQGYDQRCRAVRRLHEARRLRRGNCNDGRSSSSGLFLFGSSTGRNDV